MRKTHSTQCARIGAVLLGALLAGSAVATASAGPDIAREGVGARREALDKIELTPFDQGLWSGLTDWRNGPAVNAETARGKVVLIYTFAGYLPTAVRPVSIVNRLAERYGDKGLVVVGVHADDGYTEGVKAAERRRAGFPIARDAGGAMRTALSVDQDPDFYVIDRSGRLRYADIETASIERAVAELIGESADDAASLLDRRAADAAKQAEDARRSARLRSQIDLNNLPWVPFAPPSAEAYSGAEWPKMDTGNSRNRGRSRNADTGPIQLNLAIEQDWRPSQPTNTDGRAVLVYVFTDRVLQDLNRGGFTPIQLFAQMDRLQREHARDLIVIGAMIPAVESNSRNRRRNNDNEAEDRAKKANEVFETVVTEMPVSHLRINDYAGSFIRGRFTPNNGDVPGRSGSRNGEFIYPYHFIASSDGLIRWHGSVVTSAERAAEWEAAFAKVLAIDPGIQARREAEQAFIRSKSE